MKDSYLANGVRIGQAAAIFDVARELWAAAPWDVILSEDSLIRISCASLDLEDAVMSVIGQHRQMFGFLLFPGGLDAQIQFEQAARRGRAPTQAHTSLAYVPRRDLSTRLRREVEKFRWPLPAKGLFPLVTSVAGSGPRPPSLTDVQRIEAVAHALVDLVRIEPRLRDATFGIGSFEHTLDVTTHSGPRQLRLSAPCVPPPDDDDEIVFVEAPRTGASRQASRSRRS